MERERERERKKRREKKKEREKRRERERERERDRERKGESPRRNRDGWFKLNGLRQVGSVDPDRRLVNKGPERIRIIDK